MIELSVITKMQFKDKKQLLRHIRELRDHDSLWLADEMESAVESPTHTAEIKTLKPRFGEIVVSEIKISGLPE